MLQALDIGPGDEVILPAVQFVGVANAIVACGARPVFADVEPRTLNILPSEISRLYTARTKAVFILHYGGHPAPFADIQEAAGTSLPILEDAANAVSSTYHGRACGTLGHAGVWSFDSMKILSMADGGALWMLYDERMDKAESLRYFGKTDKQSSGLDAQANGSDRWWEFDVQHAAGRHISNDVLASIGRVQLRRLPQFIAKRRSIWNWYQFGLKDAPGLILPPDPAPGCTSSYYLYWLQTERRDELARHLCANGVYCTFRYDPLHLIPFYGCEEKLPYAEWAAEHTLNIPIHQNITEGEQGRIIALVKEFLNA
jgi:aminotransferase